MSTARHTESESRATAFSLEELATVAKLGRFHRASKGEVLVAGGAPLEGLYLVFRGHVLLRPAARRAGRSPQRVLAAGEVFGQATPGRPERSQVRATALDEVAVIHLDSESLSRLFAADLALGSRLLIHHRELLEDLLEASSQEDSPGQLVAVFGPRGGAGTTSLALLAAAHAQALGSRALVVDLHRWFGEVAPLANASSRTTLADLMSGPLDGESLEAAVQATPELELLAAPATLEDGERLDPERVLEALELALRRSDLVFVDLPDTLDEAVLDVLEAADRVLLPLTADYEGVVAGRAVLRLLDRLGVPDDAVTLTLNRFRSAGGLTPEELHRVLHRRALVVAEDQGQLLHLSNQGRVPQALVELPGHPLVRAAEAYVRELLGLARPIGGDLPALFLEDRERLPPPPDVSADAPAPEPRRVGPHLAAAALTGAVTAWLWVHALLGAAPAVP